MKLLADIEDGVWNGIDWAVRNWRNLAGCALAAVVGSVPWLLIILTGDRCD